MLAYSLSAADSVSTCHTVIVLTVKAHSTRAWDARGAVLARPSWCLAPGSWAVSVVAEQVTGLDPRPGPSGLD